MKNILNKLCQILRRSCLHTVVHALLLMFATYMLWNIRYDWTDGGSVLQIFHVLKNSFKYEDRTPEELLLINTCYDHEFVPMYDELDSYCGELNVTDRSKLLKLIQAIRKEGDYRYIVCDVAFDNKRCTESDSALYATIASMPRCIVPQMTDLDLPAVLRPKAARSEYGITIVNNNFLKYQYLQDGQPSIALRMAMDMDSVRLHRWGPFYISSGHLCNNCHVVDMETRVRHEYTNDYLEKNILQLGTEVLPYIDNGLTGMFRDKIVIIGDFFDQDIHTTVAGELSGPIITYNAYQAIRKHQNDVPLILLIVLFCTYALLIWLIKRDSPNIGKWRNGLRYLLLAMVVVIFLWTGTYVDALLMLGYFELYRRLRKFIKNLVKRRKNRKIRQTHAPEQSTSTEVIELKDNIGNTYKE